MARIRKVSVVVEDVNGSFIRMCRESPKIVRKHLSTAIFLTGGAVRSEMESQLRLGPEGQGATPFDHIKQDVENRWKRGSLSARVGIFDDPLQVAVATYQEYGTRSGTPKHPAMQDSARAHSDTLKRYAIEALKSAERELGSASGVGSGSLPRQRRERSSSSGLSRFTTTGRL